MIKITDHFCYNSFLNLNIMNTGNKYMIKKLCIKAAFTSNAFFLLLHCSMTELSCDHMSAYANGFIK